MEGSSETLKLIAENYGLPGMVLFALFLLLMFLTVGLPRMIVAIRGDKTSKTTPSVAPTRGPGTHTRQWTQEEIRTAKGDGEKLVDLKLAPLLQRLDTLEDEIIAAKDRDKTHYGKLDEHNDDIGKLQTEVAQIRTAIRARGGGSGLTEHDG